MSARVYNGKHIDVELRNGYEVVVHGPAVAVVAVDRDGIVTLVRQRRAGAGGSLLELPAGNVDEEESPLTTAQRELREETGLHGGEWLEAASFYSTPGFCDERMHLFIARGLERGEAQPEGSEELELVRVRSDELETLLAEIEDAKTLAGLLLYLREFGSARRPVVRP
jgi:ADP-ribose pyrophosphatase